MRLLITAGPTREPIDAVRFLSNRSSGRMGLAIARAALERNHAVRLLMGPGPEAESFPAGCAVERFETAADLEDLLDRYFDNCEVLIMAAAVCDFRPDAPTSGKTPRDPDRPWVVRFHTIDDLVAAVAARKRSDQQIVAFALEEPANLEQSARRKMQRKGVDAIVANPLEAMESDHVEAIWLGGDSSLAAPGPLSKTDFARWLIAKVEAAATRT